MKWLKKVGRKGYVIRFNPKNVYGEEPCCCQKGYYTKFTSSTIFCFICNIFCCRRLFKTSSWCKKYGWYKTCATCQQYGNYNETKHGVIPKKD